MHEQQRLSIWGNGAFQALLQAFTWWPLRSFYQDTDGATDSLQLVNPISVLQSHDICVLHGTYGADLGSAPE